MLNRTGLALMGLALAIGAPVAAKVKDDVLRIEVGPIWDQRDAKGKCDKAARKAGGQWTGDWTTVVPGQSSVCMVRMTKSTGSSLRWPEPARPSGGPRVEKLASGKYSVEAGPIHAQVEAQMKCPRAVGAVGGKWTGEWWTTQMGRMSVCEFTR